MECPLWSQPDIGKSSCVTCSNLCHCPDGYEDVNGTCVKGNELINMADSPNIFTFSFQGKYFISSYYKQYVKMLTAKCKV